jgi:hypothetical protein
MEQRWGWFDPERKTFPINGLHQVIGMRGDVALYHGGISD